MNGILVGTGISSFIIPESFLVAAWWSARKTQKTFKESRKKAEKQHEKYEKQRLKKHEESFDKYVARVIGYDFFGPDAHVAKIVEIDAPVRRVDAPLKPKPRVEDFQAYCVCPKCGDFQVHWIGVLSKRQKLLNRTCRNCEFNWRQKA